VARKDRQSTSDGLAGLRRGGAVTELLFLYECTTLEPSQLRPIADRLGLTVQAVSHSYRSLARRGLVEFREDRYRPTVRGTAWLHASLGRLGEEVTRRLDRLDVIRSCRAIALGPVSTGDPVSLELVDGLLSARPGTSGPSRGRVARGGPRGSLVDVSELEGIVRLSAAPIHVRTLSEEDLRDPLLAERIRRAVAGKPGALLAAQGLEAIHALRSAVDRPVARFAVAAEAREASQIGVPSTVLVLEAELPRFLAEFAGPDPPPLDVTPLPRNRAR
jgi:predicted transcriptional regulator